MCLISGTARLLEIVWLLTHDCDFRAADGMDQAFRHIFLEHMPPDFSLETHGQGLLNSPPVIAKTHFTRSFLNNIPNLAEKKIIVGLRNPKDVLVSLYHFYQMNEAYAFAGSWDEFFSVYTEGRLVYGCPVDMMLDWWAHRHEHNVLIVTYEDFIEKGAATVVRSIADFLGQEVSSENLDILQKRVSFDNMKCNPSTNYASVPSFHSEISPYILAGLL